MEIENIISNISDSLICYRDDLQRYLSSKIQRLDGDDIKDKIQKSCSAIKDEVGSPQKTMEGVHRWVCKSETIAR